MLHCTAVCLYVGQCTRFSVCWNILNYCTTVRKIAFGMLSNRWIELKVIQGNRKCRDSIGHISLTISGLYSNNVARPTLHHFQDFTTLTLHVTVCDLVSPSASIRQWKLQATCAFRSMCKRVVDNTVGYVLYFSRYDPILWRSQDSKAQGSKGLGQKGTRTHQEMR